MISLIIDYSNVSVEVIKFDYVDFILYYSINMDHSVV